MDLESQDAVRELRFKHSALLAVRNSEAWPVVDQLLADRVGRLHLDMESEDNTAALFRLQGEAKGLKAARRMLDLEISVLGNELASRGVTV